MRGTRKIIIPILFVCIQSLFGQTGGAGAETLRRGVTLYQGGKYQEAVLAFREVIVDATMESFHGEAYFWIAKAYLAMGDLDHTEKNLEFFLMNYKNSPYYPEGFYQKGRLLFLQEEYEKAIQVFYNFLNLYQKNAFAANCYYWIGESLYKLGHLDEAHSVFTEIVNKYPESYKLEAAKYRISLIELKYRENELLHLIKISHEEYLKSLDEFQKREKTYQQAIEAYQKKLTSRTSDQVKEMIADFNQQIAEKDKNIAALKAENEELVKALEAHRQRISELESVTESMSTASKPSSLSSSSDSFQAELLMIKAEALDLKAFYLERIYAEQEGTK